MPVTPAALALASLEVSFLGFFFGLIVLALALLPLVILSLIIFSGAVIGFLSPFLKPLVKSSKPFFNRLKTIIYLTDVYLKRQTFDTVWDIPLIIRKLSRSNLCYIEHGHDQLHILKYCNVREFEFIELSNIEFSEDFKPKLKTLFPVDTDFEFKYDDDNKKYSFTTKHKIQKSPNFNLERFLNSDYIKDHPSALIVQPNRVSLRDAAILSIRKKG